ncbi:MULTISPECIES: HlyD family secretion protein [unclassified Caulobacter]|uniref:HlyD family secretion protein n=1 Tax=unclassified Caulobacter TaxID=2648921 RepID=UPI000C1570B2|nr:MULTISPECIES: HlyD family secretion protein [unclassified Caulobacter]AZS23232.1 HlyD family secretion protein [Caulobacter sp. FWC26]
MRMAASEKKKLVPLILGGVTLVAVLAGGTLWFLDKQHFESTDNAFVQADTVQVSPQVSGYVAEVLVADNQRVEPGQVLAKIDPSTFQARVDQAIANAAAADAAVRAIDDKNSLEQAVIAQRAAGVTSAQADASRAKADYDRYNALAGQGWVSQQKVQTTKAAATQSAAGVASAQAALEAEKRAAQSLGSAKAQAVAQAAAAHAAVEQAKLDLERTVIRAPVGGVVGARSVRPGQLVQPGVALMSVVPLGQAYIVANFKETQVARLRVGQPVEIKADAFGKQKIVGKVDSFAPATGQEFALIPVENAVGNFTKITQRLPVKIAVDRSQLGAALRPGLSVEIKVDVRDRSGPSFAEAAQVTPQMARQGAAR